MNEETITFKIPSFDSGYNHRFNVLSEQVAQLLDISLGTNIGDEDMGEINNFVDIQVCNAIDRQAKQNELDNINGGSK